MLFLTLIFCALSALALSVPTSNTFDNFLEPRIINGDQAEKGQFPWQVSLEITQSNGQLEWCGGALIGEQWVLTAAHCCERVSHVTVRLGSVALQESDPDRVTVSTVQCIKHEGYNSMLDNDVAVVYLPKKVPINDYIKPISLAESSINTGTTVTVSGWGLTSDSESHVSPFLNYVNLKTISDSDCRTAFNSLPKGAFCAKQPGDLVQGTCEGDSGGPLVSDGIHVGVVSFGHTDGCESGQPVAFARTDFFRDWIKAQTGI